MRSFDGTITRVPAQPVPEVTEEKIDRLKALAEHPDKLVREPAEKILRWIREAGL